MKDRYKVIYQKGNGEVFERLRVTLPIQKVGEYTSMGWRILDIQYYCQYRWYSTTEYNEYKRAKRLSKDSLYWDLKEWA